MIPPQSVTENMECQLLSLRQTTEPLSSIHKMMQLPNRFKRIVKRRINYLFAALQGRGKVTPPVQAAARTRLEPGDLVTVKPWLEIEATLDRWNSTKGCAFMQEMHNYCGTQQRILKPVTRFLDERDYRVRECKRIVLLENVMCHGTVDFGPCDRSCFFFWREEWLTKAK